jgi:hypothetical protein
MNEVVIYTRQNLSEGRMPVNGSNPLPVVVQAEASSTNPAADAFGRQRVSELFTLFDSQYQYDKQPLLWDERLAGDGAATHLPNESAIDMTVGAASGASVIRQTREYFRYQPGKSQLIFCTFVLGPAVENNLKLVGYGDAENGAFIGQDGGGVFVLLRSFTSGVVSDARKVYQANWNIDPMDGTGNSGIDIDPTTTQILVIDLEWLGVGRVRIGLNIDGNTYYVHEFLNANIQTTTYMTTANLPIRYENTNTGAATASTLKAICCQVASEGGLTETSPNPFSSTPRLDVTIPDANPVPLVAIRPALLFNGVANRSKIIPESLDVLVQSGEAVVEIYYNPTITDGAWASVDPSSSVEENTTLTAFTGGTVIARLLGAAGGTAVASGRPLLERLPFGIGIDADDPTVLMIAAYEITGNPAVSANISWREIR